MAQSVARVDLASERWACWQCPFALSWRPLTLVPEKRPADAPESIPGRPAANRPPGQADFATAEPPVLPFLEGTNSSFYVPLLLDAAGMLSPVARRVWHAHPVIGTWWPHTVAALLARPFLPVQELANAVGHVERAFASSVQLFPSLHRFRERVGPRQACITSLAELLPAIAVQHEGHYLAAPLQEALLTLLLGPAAVGALERLIDDLRRPLPAPTFDSLGLDAAGAAQAAGATPARVDTRDHAGAEPTEPPAAFPSCPPHGGQVVGRGASHVAAPETDDFVALAAASVVESERRARGRGRRGGRGRGRGRPGREHAPPPSIPAAVQDDAPPLPAKPSAPTTAPCA